MLVQHRLMAPPNVDIQRHLVTCTCYTVFSGDTLLLNCNIMSNARATSPGGYSECGYTKTPSDTCYTVFSGDTLLLNCNIMPNARGTSPDGYSECGYTKAPSDTCYTVFSGDTLLLNCNVMSNARTTSSDRYSECGHLYIFYFYFACVRGNKNNLFMFLLIPRKIG